MIASFIDEQRAKGRAVESVYTVLREQGVRIAARTYRAMKHRDASVRDRADAVDVDVSLSTVDQPKGMYGQRKMVAYLRRTGHGVSHRRVDRLMWELGMNGRVRGRRVRTTVPDPTALRAPDLLDHDSSASAITNEPARFTQGSERAEEIKRSRTDYSRNSST